MRSKWVEITRTDREQRLMCGPIAKLAKGVKHLQLRIGDDADLIEEQQACRVREASRIGCDPLAVLALYFDEIIYQQL